jgi:uracil-DNA glycosylase
MTPNERLQAWAASKQRISTCRECLDRWPSRIEQSLRPDEIPDPRRDVSILFVGVAPPPLGREEDDNTGHFYSNPCDRLRLGLFHALDRVCGTDLNKQNRVSREVGTTAFLEAGFFFVHAAKVHPCGGRLAPPRTVMRFCAKQHLASEILLLSPKAVCFLGATNAAPAAQSVFGHSIGETPEPGEIGGGPQADEWRGWVAVTVQPVRGTKEGSNLERAAKAIERLNDLISDSQHST